MSRETLAQVVERASADPVFRAQLESNPSEALAAYDLSEAERAALISRDAGRLENLGVDVRLSKWDETNQGPFASGGD